MDIGSRIRKIRMRQHLTLQDIAAACGCTKSLLSKIENGKTVPPVATLSKIAKVLGVKLAELVEEGRERASVYEKTSSIRGKDFIRTERGYYFFPFAACKMNKLMQPFLFTAKKGDILKGSFSHSGEEFIFMLEGEMDYIVGNVSYRLCQGDTLYFDSDEPHTLKPLSDEVKYLAVFCENSDKKKSVKLRVKR